MSGRPTAPRRLLVISAGLRTPSSTRLLADRLRAAAVTALRARGLDVADTTVELREHARDLTAMLLTGTPTPALTGLLDEVGRADAVVLVTPIYSGAYTGMVKDLVDLLPEDALAGVPVLMGATGGTGRHALALDHTLRPLLGHVHAVTVPTAVFAATEDFATEDPQHPLGARVARAADELAALVAGRPPRVQDDPWDVSGVAELLTDL
ncbi:NAD(P)H-dependent oxidoreductase [Actinotalea sp. M2MS4P-6]|uniref:CE1759 family FMN reductase n=1 Tax=Actinotalea sp. M2MS4P-6 TaxID=2983762 RepID=UPI0021E4FEAD|nr:CE1759 family FMN reductase [Actinotalea sp. M2MS4P-6]MCV2395868.1 NAD(P)H-dependent oxidoreductase [Actinotalea sp. M2MS4P-6]